MDLEKITEYFSLFTDESADTLARSMRDCGVSPGGPPASRDAADIRNYFLAQAADLLDCPAQPLLGVAG